MEESSIIESSSTVTYGVKERSCEETATEEQQNSHADERSSILSFSSEDMVSLALLEELGKHVFDVEDKLDEAKNWGSMYAMLKTNWMRLNLKLKTMVENWQ